MYRSLAIFFFSVSNESIEENTRGVGCGFYSTFLFYFSKLGRAEREERDDRRKKNLLVKVGPVRGREGVQAG